jgi:hypothetical protein
MAGNIYPILVIKFVLNCLKAYPWILCSEIQKLWRYKIWTFWLSTSWVPCMWNASEGAKHHKLSTLSSWKCEMPAWIPQGCKTSQANWWAYYKATQNIYWKHTSCDKMFSPHDLSQLNFSPTTHIHGIRWNLSIVDCNALGVHKFCLNQTKVKPPYKGLFAYYYYY